MEDVESKILSRIGKRVKFNYPKGEGTYYGKLKDRCVLRVPSWTGVPYWDVVDLIEFEEPKRFEAIRFGYYRLKNGKLKWASQTTLTEPIEVYKKLFVKAAKEKEWFKKFLKEVLEEAKNTK